MNTTTFARGVVACVALMLAFSGVIALLNRGNNRPEGVAEDWLTAIGDTTREGVEGDATRRADAIGAPELAREILHPYAEEIDRKAGFESLEVGKAEPVDGSRGDSVLVGFRVVARRPLDTTVELQGVLTLQQHADEWQVVDVAVVDPATRGLEPLPSQGGPPPSSAPWTLWAGALVGAAVVGVVSSALVRAAGRTTDAPARA